MRPRSFDLAITADCVWGSVPTDQGPSGLETADSLERCSCLTKMPVVFKMLELVPLEGSTMLRMIELEVAMLQLAIPLPMAGEHHTFEDLESFASIGGEPAEPHP